MQQENTQRFTIIDDDRISNMICEKVLKDTFPGVQVYCFLSPEAGLHFLEASYAEGEQGPMVVLLDINMPEINGWEVLERFGAFPDEIKTKVDIFMLSSSICPEDKARAAANPYVSGFISKPLSPVRLRELFAVA